MDHKPATNLFSLMLLPALFAVANTADARPSIPPTEPPICSTDARPEDLQCPIAVIYSSRDCGDEGQDPGNGGGGDDGDGDQADDGTIHLCATPLDPIVPHIQCTPAGSALDCEGFPTSSPKLEYTWKLTGPLRAQSVLSTNDLDVNRNIRIYCTVRSGEGTLSLTIPNPISGVETTTTVPVTCFPEPTDRR